MIIKNLFEKDINRSIQGVVTIGNEDEEQKWQELVLPLMILLYDFRGLINLL